MLLLDEMVETVAEALDSDAIKTTHFDVDKDQMDVSSTGDETQYVGVKDDELATQSVIIIVKGTCNNG
jgi:hypothetical protein